MMGVSSYLRGFFSDFLIYSNMVILGIIGLPFAIASEKWAYSFIKLYIWTCFVVLRLVANIRVECRGEVPSGNVLICSKHMSFLDILMLAYYLPRASFVMKRELIWTPIIGIYGLRIGCVPVTRGGGARTLNTMLKNYEDASDNADGKQIIIYPQGTRVHPKESRKYKIGAGFLYEQLKLPCHLVGTNTGIFWPKGSLKRTSGVAVIEFSKLLQSGLSVGTFMSEMEKNIENSSNLLIEEVEKVGSK